MKTWLYLVELERLQIPETVPTFEKCNKEGLVRGIWRKHSHERRAVRLVADLCLDYEIYDVQLWNSMLQQLLAFGMVGVVTAFVFTSLTQNWMPYTYVDCDFDLILSSQLEYLRHVLVCLSGFPALWHVDCIQKMWRTVLQRPLVAGTLMYSFCDSTRILYC